MRRAAQIAQQMLREQPAIIGRALQAPFRREPLEHRVYHWFGLHLAAHERTIP